VAPVGVGSRHQPPFSIEGAFLRIPGAPASFALDHEIAAAAVAHASGFVLAIRTASPERQGRPEH